MDFKILILILIIASRICVAIIKSKTKEIIAENEDEGFEPVEREDEIPEIFRTIFQTEEKKGNVREGSNLPPPVPNMQEISEMPPSPRDNSYGDFVAYNSVDYEMSTNSTVSEVENNTEETRDNLKKSEREKNQTDVMKNFNLQQAVIFSEILSPKFKEY